MELHITNKTQHNYCFLTLVDGYKVNVFVHLARCVVRQSHHNLGGRTGILLQGQGTVRIYYQVL